MEERKLVCSPPPWKPDTKDKSKVGVFEQAWSNKSAIGRWSWPFHHQKWRQSIFFSLHVAVVFSANRWLCITETMYMDQQGGYNQERACTVHCRYTTGACISFFSTRQLAKPISWIRLSLFSRHQCLLFTFNNNTMYLNSGAYQASNQCEGYNKQLSAANLIK